jgi:hypothetical protein
VATLRCGVEFRGGTWRPARSASYRAPGWELPTWVRKEKVLRLKVPVRNPPVVQVFHSVHDLGKEITCVLLRVSAQRHQALEQLAACHLPHVQPPTVSILLCCSVIVWAGNAHQLKHQVHLVLGVVCFVEVYDIGVSDLRPHRLSALPKLTCQLVSLLAWAEEARYLTQHPHL